MQNTRRQGFGPGGWILKSFRFLFLWVIAFFAVIIFPTVARAQQTGVVSFSQAAYSAVASQSNAPINIVFTGTTDTTATVDFMTIYPTLCELAGLPIPAHVQGKSIRSLLEDPKAAWDQPAVTTYMFNNHTVRTEDWRYIRYANGDEELYHDAEDPYEWTNLAMRPEFARI